MWCGWTVLTGAGLSVRHTHLCRRALLQRHCGKTKDSARTEEALQITAPSASHAMFIQ